MTKPDHALVLEALQSARTELQTLADENVHVPSGDLLEQIDEAITIMELSPNA